MFFKRAANPAEPSVAPTTEALICAIGTLQNAGHNEGLYEAVESAIRVEDQGHEMDISEDISEDTTQVDCRSILERYADHYAENLSNLQASLESLIAHMNLSEQAFNEQRAHDEAQLTQLRTAISATQKALAELRADQQVEVATPPTRRTKKVIDQ